MKAFALYQMTVPVCDRLQNNVGKGENDGYYNVFIRLLAQSC